jgi:nucleotide-binding universal stress UspA family protein
MSTTEQNTPIEEQKRVEPLTPIEARHATEDALHAAAAGQAETIEVRRHGMVEAETRRITEQVTVQARERMHAAHADASASPASAPVAPALRTLPAALPIHQIVVPLDGTPEAECALPYAAAVAQLTGAAITLVNVAGAEMPSVAAMADRAINGVIASREDTRRAVPGYLVGLRERMAQSIAHVSYQVLHAASVIEALVTYEARAHADLAILATRHHERSGLFPVGRLAESLLRRGPAALLLVPIEVSRRDVSVAPLTRLLVPLDGSPLSETALAPLRTLCSGAGEQSTPRHVTLLTVEERRSEHSESKTYLDAVRASLAAALAPAPVEFETLVAHGMAGDVLASAAHGSLNAGGSPARYDLVLMATHGRGGVGRWLFGSVAEYALRSLKVPMLLMRVQHAD